MSKEIKTKKLNTLIDFKTKFKELEDNKSTKIHPFLDYVITWCYNNNVMLVNNKYEVDVLLGVLVNSDLYNENQKRNFFKTIISSSIVFGSIEEDLDVLYDNYKKSLKVDIKSTLDILLKKYYYNGFLGSSGKTIFELYLTDTIDWENAPISEDEKKYVIWYDLYLKHEQNISELMYFTNAHIFRTNLAVEQIPDFVINQIKFNKILKKGYIDEPYDLIDIDSQGIYNNLFIGFKEIGYKEREIERYIQSDFNIKKIDILSKMCENIITDDKTEYDKMMYAIPVAKENRTFYEGLLTQWMLECFDTWFTDNANKHILVIKSEQSAGKDPFLKNLFTKPFSGVNQKYVVENYRFDSGKDEDWKIVSSTFAIDGETEAVTKKTIEGIKRITSDNYFRIRRPYDRIEGNYKRTANFIACSNQDTLYKDDTGGSRFYVIELTEPFKFLNPLTEKYEVKDDFIACDDVDWSKVWGYVYYMYKNGLGQYNHEFDIERLKEISEENRVISTLELILKEYLISCADRTMTRLDILEHIKTTKKLDFTSDYHGQKFGYLMKNLNFKHYKTNGIYKYYCTFNSNFNIENRGEGTKVDADEVIAAQTQNKYLFDLEPENKNKFKTKTKYSLEEFNNRLKNKLGK